MTSIDSKVIEIIGKSLDIEDFSITPSLSLADDLRMDSLCFVETIIAIENEFRIGINDHDAGDVVTVGDLIGLVQHRVVDSLRANVSAKKHYEYQAVWRKTLGVNKQISKEVAE